MSEDKPTTLSLVGELLGGIGALAGNPAFGTAAAVAQIATLGSKLILLGGEGLSGLQDLNTKVAAMVSAGRNPSPDEWQALRAASDKAHRQIQGLPEPADDDAAVTGEQAGADAPNPDGGQSGAAAATLEASAKRTSDALKRDVAKSADSKPADAAKSAEAKATPPADAPKARTESSTIPPKRGVTQHSTAVAAPASPAAAKADSSHVVGAQTISEDGKNQVSSVGVGSAPQNAGTQSK